MRQLDFDTTSPAFSQLCELRQALQPKFEDSLRPCRAAMVEACKCRPDLAAAARKKPALSDAQAHGNADSPLLAAAERMAASRRG